MEMARWGAIIFLAIVVLLSAGAAAYFSAKHLGRWWWLSFALLTLPPLWFYFYVGLDNYRGGNPEFLWVAVPSGTIILIVTWISSQIGRRRR